LRRSLAPIGTSDTNNTHLGIIANVMKLLIFLNIIVYIYIIVTVLLKVAESTFRSESSLVNLFTPIVDILTKSV